MRYFHSAVMCDIWIKWNIAVFLFYLQNRAFPAKMNVMRFIKKLVTFDIVETTDICTETTNFTPVSKGSWASEIRCSWYKFHHEMQFQIVLSHLNLENWYKED